MGNNGSLVSLQSLQCNLSNLGLRLAHEHLAGGGQHLLILTLNLHLDSDGRKKVFNNVNGSQQRNNNTTENTLYLLELHNYDYYNMNDSNNSFI